MAWYDTSKNRGHKGANGWPEPGYGRNAYPEHVHLPMVVQAEYHNAQRYEYQAEQVVEYRRGGGGFNLAEHNGSPRARDGYKHQGLGNKAHLVPWKPTHEWSESGNESSPKAHNYEKIKAGSPQYYKASGNESSPKAHNYEKTKAGSPRYYKASGNESSPKAHNYEKTKADSPRYYGANHLYPKPQHNHVGYNNSSSGDEGNDSGSDSEKYDVVGEDEGFYPKSRGGNRAKPKNYLHEDGHEKPKAKPTYRAPHTVPHSTQPAKDPYYEKPSNPRYYENPNRNTHSPPAYGTAPAFPAQDGKRTYYEQEQPPNRPFINPPQIKTKPRDEGPKETINSSEAKKRYGGVAVPTEPKYNGTIDCKEAAKRYNGIFVPGY